MHLIRVQTGGHQLTRLAVLPHVLVGLLGVWGLLC